MSKKTSLISIGDIFGLLGIVVICLLIWKDYDNRQKSIESITIIKPVVYLPDGTVQMTLKNSSNIFATNISMKCTGIDKEGDTVKGELFISDNLFAKETRVFTFKTWNQKEYTLALQRVQKKKKLKDVHSLKCSIKKARMAW